MQTYIKSEEVEGIVYSLIKDSNHLKRAMKDMTRSEEDEFINNIMNGNFTMLTKEEIGRI